MIYIGLKVKWGNLISRINLKGEIEGLWFEGQRYFPDIDEHATWLDVDDTNDSRNPVNDETGLSQFNRENGTYQISVPNGVDEKVEATIRALIQQLEEYESGTRVAFDLPLAPVGSEFRQKVWSILEAIPCGETTTYGRIGEELAKEMGKASMSAQAVGGAVGHNPISIIIPCHRVVGSDGSLTGYAGGVDKKEALLRHEGAIN